MNSLRANLNFHYTNLKRAITFMLLMLLAAFVIIIAIRTYGKPLQYVNISIFIYYIWNTMLAVSFLLLYIYLIYLCIVPYSEYFGLSQNISITRKNFYKSLTVFYAIVSAAIALYFSLGGMINVLLRRGPSVFASSSSLLLNMIIVVFIHYFAVASIGNLISSLIYKYGKILGWSLAGVIIVFYFLPLKEFGQLGVIRDNISAFLNNFFSYSMFDFSSYDYLETNMTLAAVKLVLASVLFYIGWLNVKKMPVK